MTAIFTSNIMNENRSKRVAIVGAGSSGLTSIKACKEENFDVVCYEKTDNVGGLWRYREEDVEGLASVMRSTIINSSKEISAFSDFPPPKQFPNYMHNTVMIRYLEMYSQKFDLVRHIKFRHEVLSVKPSEDYEETGRWDVTVKDLANDVTTEITYDAIMVCTGHHWFPLRPTFPGEEEFVGRIVHTHSYKKPNEYENKRVVVIGVGNSGGDAAVELSNIAKQVYLSTRRGCWVIHRIGYNGKPFDAFFINRIFNFVYHIVPEAMRSYVCETLLNMRFNHSLYQLQPKHGIFSQHPMVNDALPNRILSGTVVIKGNIKRFVKTGIIFEGEDKVTEADEVILATGYDISYPFLSEDILNVEDNKVKLYKFVFPPHLKHPTLSIIGLIQIVGGIFPIMEIQARWVTQILANKVALPSVKGMFKDIKKAQNEMDKRYFAGHRHTIQVDYVDYLDDISSLFGAKPNLFSMLLTDPPLFWECVTGPCLPYQYRLQGPHSWSAARHTIMRYQERVTAALKTRYVPVEKQKENDILRYFLGSFMTLFFAIYFFAMFL